MPVRYLNTLFGDGKSRSLAASLYHYECQSEHGKWLIARLNRIIEHCLANPFLLGDPVYCNELAVCLEDDLAELGLDLKNGPVPISRSARRKTLSRALEFGESVKQKISVPQFAAALAINRRSLELAFREFLGITPRQYLNYRRLHGVHEELLRLPPGSHCITEVATR